MPNWPEGKRPKTRKDKAKGKAKGPRTPHGKPTSDTEHPVMEVHPGAREVDPETGEKPKPVKKPRTRKPKSDETGNAPAPEPGAGSGVDAG